MFKIISLVLLAAVLSLTGCTANGNKAGAGPGKQIRDQSVNQLNQLGHQLNQAKNNALGITGTRNHNQLNNGFGNRPDGLDAGTVKSLRNQLSRLGAVNPRILMLGNSAIIGIDPSELRQNNIRVRSGRMTGASGGTKPNGAGVAAGRAGAINGGIPNAGPTENQAASPGTIPGPNDATGPMSRLAPIPGNLGNPGNLGSAPADRQQSTITHYLQQYDHNFPILMVTDPKAVKAMDRVQQALTNPNGKTDIAKDLNFILRHSDPVNQPQNAAAQQTPAAPDMIQSQQPGPAKPETRPGYQ